MKARVKATGEIVEVFPYNKDGFAYIDEDGVTVYEGIELEVDEYNPDYWTRLEHQAAIAAMGGMCGNAVYKEMTWKDADEYAIGAAHALVEKLKENTNNKIK